MLILASQSPRRQQILTQANIPFTIHPSAAEEIHDPDIPPSQLCLFNAILKASDISRKFPNHFVLGADTLVFLNQTPLGKPKSLDEAADTLAKLSGKTHEVITAIAIACPDGSTLAQPTSSFVTFKTLTPSDIQNYLSRINPLDKAGSYAIQEHGDLIVESISGPLDNIIGLPLSTLTQLLARLGIGNL